MTAQAQRYVMRRLVLGSRASVEITKDNYEHLCQLTDQLKHLLDVEEKFDILKENYFELESTILTEALREMVTRTFDSIEFQILRRLLARRIANFLSSTRLYLDSLPYHSRVVLKHHEAALSEIIGMPSSEYDRSENYRIAEALRNYAQHRSLPLHGLSVRMKKDMDKNPSELAYSLSPSLAYVNLHADGKFKAAVLDELRGKDPIPLKPILRSYTESIGAIHERFRKLASPISESCVAQLTTATKEFEQHGEGTVGLAIFLTDDREHPIRKPTYLYNSLIEQYEYFNTRFSSTMNLARRRVDF